MRRAALALLASGLLATAARAQEPKIADNSFLMEEAYNQEPGVVQHISNLAALGPSPRDWAYTFTQEWPLGGMTHQLSYTVPVLFPSGSATAFGDILLNYRYQLVDKSRVAVAPRASLLLPTGSWQRQNGNGAFGVQVNLPASVRVVPQVTMHFNAGTTILPGARGPTGARRDLVVNQLGVSAIGPVLLPFNFMVETVALWAQSVDAAGAVVHDQVTIVNPGFRFALNFGHLQVVPGFSVPIRVSESGTPHDLFFYLSFEHPFMHVDAR